jgi:HEAT repeat protein
MQMRWAGIGLMLVAGALSAAAEGGDAVKDLRYGTVEVRDAALDQVLAGKAPQAGPALMELLEESKGAVKLKTIRGLGLLREEKAVRPLMVLLGDPSADFRLASAKALGRIADKASAPALAKILKDSDDEVREAAARALGDCADPAQSKALLALLQDKNRLVRLAAVDALGRLGADEALPGLQAQLKDTDPSYQRHVVTAIGSLKTDKVLPFLRQSLSSKDAYLRAYAAEALAGRPKSPELEQALLVQLSDGVYAVRVRAVETLGIWKSKAAVAPLLKALRANEPTLRWKAAQALGAIGDPSTREALDYVAKNDSEAEIKAAAATALKALP